MNKELERYLIEFSEQKALQSVFTSYPVTMEYHSFLNDSLRFKDHKHFIVKDQFKNYSLNRIEKILTFFQEEYQTMLENFYKGAKQYE